MAEHPAEGFWTCLQVALCVSCKGGCVFLHFLPLKEERAGKINLPRLQGPSYSKTFGIKLAFRARNNSLQLGSSPLGRRNFSRFKRKPSCALKTQLSEVSGSGELVDLRIYIPEFWGNFKVLALIRYSSFCDYTFSTHFSLQMTQRARGRFMLILN